MSDRFMTTRWTWIVAARRNDDQARAALAELCQAYWRPVYAFMRRHGRSPEEAADVTQSFFLHLLEHRAFDRADESRGRFRSFLLASARNFLCNARDREVAQRRGGDSPHESIDVIAEERAFALESTDPLTSPDAAFERQWALRIMERAIERLRRDYTDRGQAHLFDQLRSLLTSTGPRSPHGSTPDVLEPASRSALHRLRQRFGAALRAEIGDTVGNLADVDDELRHLLQVVSR